MKISEQTKEELQRLITVGEAAARLKVTVARIHQLINDGRLPVLKLQFLIDPDDLSLIEPKRKGRPPGHRFGIRGKFL